MRITYLGDSLSADDWLAQRLRDALVPRFGDGGPGFVHVVPPHKFCRARTVKRTASASWKLWGVATPFPADRLLGYGGGSVESQGGATVKFSPRTNIMREKGAKLRASGCTNTPRGMRPTISVP